MRQSHKMAKHTQTIRGQIADELLSLFDHFVGLAFKGVKSLKTAAVNFNEIIIFSSTCFPGFGEGNYSI